MARYAITRVLAFIPVLFVASILVWLMIFLVPGDPVLTRLGADASPAQIASERQAMGLDKPVVVQYGIWLKHAVQGDFGRSTANGESVRSLIARTYPATLGLTIGGLLLGTLIGMFLGVASAVRGGSTARFVGGYTSFALAIPTFWVGMLLVWLFALYLKWFPSSGYVPFFESPTEYLKHMILPVVTLAFYASGIVTRFAASAMGEAMGQDYIWTAHAKGIPSSTVIRRHGLRNALIPITTVLGLQLGLLLGGAVIIEAVFNIPGMGRLLLSSVSRRDYPVVQAEVLLILTGVALINIFVDLVYGFLDPRIRR